MKKLLLILILSLVYFIGTAQKFPTVIPSGNPKTLDSTAGAVKAIAFINGVYSDTTTANLNLYIKYYNGAQIITTTDSAQFWIRYNNKWIKPAGSGGGGSTTDTVIVLRTVTDIASFSKTTANQLNVKDTVRGGVFYQYSGTDAADNGMIFTDANGRKWLRQTTTPVVEARWYNMRAATVGDNHDNTDEFNAAYRWVTGHWQFNEIHFAADNTLFFGSGSLVLGYRFNSTITIGAAIKITGDGTLLYPATKMWFNHCTAFDIGYTYGQSGFSVQMSNLAITQGNQGVVLADTVHGIKARTFIHLQNVVIDQFEGNGVYITACGDVPNGDHNNYGNADLSVLENVTVSNCINGIFIEGCDANSILISNSNTAVNKRWGIYDNGQLGNAYIKPHCAANGVASAGVKTVCTYLGVYYAAIPGHDGYFTDAVDSNYNKQPDLNIGTYWEVITPMASTGAWSSSTRYYSGGAICIRNVNAWCSIFNSYTESFQPPIYLNARSFVDGGDNGAGVVGGIFRNNFQGEQQFLNGGVIMNKYLAVGTGTADAAAVLTIYNDQAVTGAYVGVQTEGSTVQVYNRIKNNTGKYAQLGYNGNDYVTYVENNKLITTHNASGLFPGDDNTLNLGSVSLRWKDLYAATYHGDGSLLTGITSTWRNPMIGDTLLTNPSSNVFLLKSFVWGYGMTSSTNDTSVLPKVDTAILFPAIRATISTPTSGWALTGNAGTTAGTNFVGTTDSVDLVIKTNGVESGRLNIDNHNTTYGRYTNSTGSYNVLIGETASVGSGTFSVVVGQNAGNGNTGTGLTAIGQSAGNSNGGNQVTAIGQSAGAANYGNYAVLIGQNTGDFNGGDSVTAIGWAAAYSNTGTRSTFLGSRAGQFANPYRDIVALGYNSHASANKQLALSDSINAIKATGIATGAGYVLTDVSGTGIFTAAAPSGGLSGLTTNKIPKATSSTTIGNSHITDDGTTVDITNTPGGSSPSMTINTTGFYPLELFNTNPYAYFTLGVARSLNNAFAMHYTQNGTNSTSNTIGFGFSANFDLMTLEATGRFGIGTVTPTAWLHLPAGIATAGFAPLKFESGTNLTTIANGTIEYNGTDYFASAGGTRQTINKGRSGSFSQVGTATTVFTVTFGGTQPNATYKVNVTPTAALSAALFYVTNKTTTTFDVTFLAGLTGTVTFDYVLVN